MPVIAKKPYYECHITLDNADPIDAQVAIEAFDWKFSKIDGDPVVGAGVRCCATMHYNAATSQEDVLSVLNGVANMLQDHGFKVTRRKIEMVLHDHITKD